MKLLVVLLIADAISAITIGKIENCTYAPVSANSLTFNASTCTACLCDAFLRYSPSFVALNCFLSGQRCELFFNYSTPFDMLANPNSTFYCYPDLPPIPTTLGRGCAFYFAFISIILTVMHWSLLFPSTVYTRHHPGSFHHSSYNTNHCVPNKWVRLYSSRNTLKILIWEDTKRVQIAC